MTEPSFHVPWILTSGKDTDTSSGRIFLDTQFSRQNAVYFANGKGQIQWYHPTDGSARMTRVQSYNGHRVITFWQGRYVCPPCGGQGEGVILNSSYKTIHTVHAGDGYQQQGTDLHEFALGHQGSEGTAFVQIWSPVHVNNVLGHGPGVVYDWIIQEIDVATDKVIWEWHALGHVPLSDSYLRYTAGQPYDYFHLNSVQQLPDGRILISGHSTWTIYSINKKTGRFAWELGGKHSSIKVGTGANFEWQHDAALHGHGLLTVFDDGGYFSKVEPQSRALVIRLADGRATLVHAYTHNPPESATAAGSVQILPNHNVFVGWGQAPYFSEYTQSGRQIFSDRFFRPTYSYRAYRLRWNGHPPWPPAVAVRRTSAQSAYNVYVSWNGATEVARWRVLAGRSSTGPFKPLKTVAWASFETRIPVSTSDSYFEVRGLGQRGKLLPHGVSAAVQAGK